MFQRMLPEELSGLSTRVCIPRALGRSLTGLCAGLIFSVAGYGGQASQKTTVITSNVEEVSMDVVAHDKHGRAIRDLRADELQITDDGHAAKITGLRLVTTSDEPSADLGGHAKEIRSISFVFDGLHGDANSIALRAAEYVLKETAEKDFYFSVWRLTNRLELAQTLTNDQPALKRALEKTVKPPSGKPQAASSFAPPPQRDSPALPEPARSFAVQLEITAALATRIGRDENLRSLPVCWR